MCVGHDIHSSKGTAPAWFEAMVPRGVGAEAVVFGVAARQLARRAGVALHPTAHVRVRTQSGHWSVVECDDLTDPERNDMGLVVTIRPAAARDMLGLLCAAYRLTPRERQVIQLLVDGLDTRRRQAHP